MKNKFSNHAPSFIATQNIIITLLTSKFAKYNAYVSTFLYTALHWALQSNKNLTFDFNFSFDRKRAIEMKFFWVLVSLNQFIKKCNNFCQDYIQRKKNTFIDNPSVNSKFEHRTGGIGTNSPIEKITWPAFMTFLDLIHCSMIYFIVYY